MFRLRRNDAPWCEVLPVVWGRGRVASLLDLREPLGGRQVLRRVRNAVRRASAHAARPVDASPVAERRVTSVLFGDLVGFTPLSETKDAEEVRELLSAYFDRSAGS